MKPLCTAAAALTVSALFLFVWAHMPVCWLFDTTDRTPHPKAGLARSRALPIGVFFCFFALSFILHFPFSCGSFSAFSEKVAEIGDFPCPEALDYLPLWLMVLFSLLLFSALTDCFYRLIPDQVSVGIALLGVIRLILSSLRTSENAFVNPVLPLTLCTALTACFYMLPKMLTGRPAMGLGDIKLLYALAFALPPALYISTLIRTALLSGVAAAGMILIKQSERGVPYAAVLAAGVFWSLLFS